MSSDPAITSTLLSAGLLDEILEQMRQGALPDVAELAARYGESPAETEHLMSVVQLIHEAADRADPTAALDARVHLKQEKPVLGDFRLLREIARGGMGVVYEAEQISLDREAVQAERLLQRRLDLVRETPGEQHFEYGVTFRVLGRNLHLRGQMAEAEAAYRRAVEMLRHIVGSRHLETMNCCYFLADFLYARAEQQPALAAGLLEESAALFAETYEVRRDILGPGHCDTIHSAVSLADTLKVLGRADEAAALLAEVQTAEAAASGPEAGAP